MRIIFVSCLFLLASMPAFAHNPITDDGQDRWASLTSVIILVAFWLVYIMGAKSSRPKLRYVVLFHSALILCFVAVLGPLDEWAETNEAAHMSQHMLFMTVIAPIWVISRPLPQFMAGINHRGSFLWHAIISLTCYPMICAYLHGIVIWFWHVPFFYILALENPWWHIIEHACFILTAGLFWWSVLKSSRARAPWALLALLFTLMHTGVLGALLTFAPEPLYGHTDNGLVRQQLAGLIMWVAGGIPYIAASGWLGWRWYNQLRERMGPLRE